MFYTFLAIFAIFFMSYFVIIPLSHVSEQAGSYTWAFFVNKNLSINNFIIHREIIIFCLRIMNRSRNDINGLKIIKVCLSAIYNWTELSIHTMNTLG